MPGGIGCESSVTVTAAGTVDKTVVASVIGRNVAPSTDARSQFPKTS